MQAAARRMFAVRSYNDDRRAAITIQKHIRRLIVQVQTLIKHAAARMIQAHWRGCVARAIMMDTVYEQLLVQTTERNTIESAVRTLQRAWRKHMNSRPMNLNPAADTLVGARDISFDRRRAQFCGGIRSRVTLCALDWTLNRAHVIDTLHCVSVALAWLQGPSQSNGTP